MEVYTNWQEMLKTICTEKGWQENKNCKIKYEAQVDVEQDKINYIAKVYPYGQIEEIEFKVCVE